MDPLYSSDAQGGQTGHALSLPTSLKSQLITLGITPRDPVSLLAAHLDVLPLTILRQLGALVPPRERARIPRIRQRRHLWAHRPASPPPDPFAGADTSADVSADPAAAATRPQLPSEALPGSTLGARRPVELTAAEGRIRWPLLWEQLGGDTTLVPATAAQRDAVRWAQTQFMPGSTQHVGRLGRLMGEEEEMGAWQAAAQNRARERRLQAEGEEFDSESESESEAGNGDGDGGAPGPARQANGAGHGRQGGERERDRERDDRERRGLLSPAALEQFAAAVAEMPNCGPSAPPAAPRPAPAAAPARSETPRSQAAVEAEFEKRLLELFLDGLDTIDYDAIDFTPADDPIGDRDRLDAYFDDEAPSNARGGTGNGHGHGDKAMENGQGEYDY